MLAVLLVITLLGVTVDRGFAQKPAKVKVLIAFTHQPGPAEEALVRGVGGGIKYTYHLIPAIAASLPEAALDGLRKNPNVTVIEVDGQVQVVNAEMDNTWGVQHIGTSAVHGAGNKGRGIKVAVLDTGIDTDHPDLSYDPTCSASFVTGESLDDGHSHGTHTAGTVAALDNDSGVVGIAPLATLCIYKVLNNSGNGYYSDIIAALQQAVTDGVQVTNNSYGGSGDPGSTVKAAFDNAYAAGVLHVGAAGNYGNLEGTGDTCIYPARWDSVIATAATTQSDIRASFSSTCTEVELAAPGDLIYSTMPGGGYGYKSGTSMASPHAAGMAALVLAAHPGWTNADVRKQLQVTASDLGNPGRDPWYGFGLVDAPKAAEIPLNSPPLANDQAVTTNEDAPVPIALSGSDADGDALTYSVISGPSNGTLSGSAPNLTYTPKANFNGSDSLTFQVHDGAVDSNIATVSLTITPADDPPVANPQSVTTAEDISAAILLSGSDVDGNTLTFSVVSSPANGTLSGSAPNLTYTPKANFSGSDSFTFKVTDGTADSNIATVSLSVTAVNDAPIAQGQSVTTDEDTPVSIILTSSDSDGDALTFSVVSGPSNGTLSGSAPNLTYTPKANFTGTDSFAFKASDGNADSAIATVSLTVTSVNDAPIANGQSVTTIEETPTSVLLTGSDVEGAALTFSVVSGPSSGSLSGSAPDLTYTPGANFSGTDSVTFKTNDGAVDSNIATVSLIVTPVNDAPVANGQSVTTAEDAAVPIALSGSDADGHALTFSVISGPSNGTLSGSAPSLTYTPKANFNGSDSLTFQVHDGAVDSNIATVSLTITPADDPPVANPQSVTTAEDISAAILLSGSDVDGNTLTFSVVSSPANGTLSGSAPNLTYTPKANFSGSDSFTFKVTDGTADSNIATVSLSVTAVNDPPVADSQSVSTQEDTPVSILLSGSDADGDALTFSVVSGPSNGILSGSASNLTYTPKANFNGSDSFTFVANDGNADSAIATVSLTVTSVNDAPVANGQSVTTIEETPTSVLLTGSDVEGAALTFSVISGPASGTLSGSAPDLTYTPGANFSGTDSFTFKTNDGAADSNIATVSLTVTPAADLLTITKTSYISGKKRLDVEASSSARGGVILTATAFDAEGNALGNVVMSYNAKKRIHQGTITGLASKPFRVQVTSSGGGSASVEGPAIGG